MTICSVEARQSAFYDLDGIEVLPSIAVPPPAPPGPGEYARRLIRHGLVDVLEQLGEKPGPKPEDLVHTVLLIGQRMHAHPQSVSAIRAAL